MSRHARGKRKSMLACVGLVLGLALGTVLFVVALPVVSLDSAVAAPAGWDVTQLTNDSQGNYHANTDGKWLVWLRAGADDVMVRNLGTGETR